MSLIQSEKKYWKTLEEQYKQLFKLYNEINSKVSLSLSKKEITRTILLRMKIYYETQNKIKKFLNKRYLSAASDFFVEAIIFYLKLVLEKNKIDYEVHSERKIIQKQDFFINDINKQKQSILTLKKKLTNEFLSCKLLISKEVQN
jgi:hypothetical protein